ncbi:MAG: hypothetical protein QGF09_09875 [Rhodospirillales bacterium]|nr:hypothetical protein [Rhodospirillales bacterium]
MNRNRRIVYGDIHNHNAHGYGLGSIERSVDIARGHLDFFAFTGHSSWHDLGRIEGGAEAHFNDGYKRLAETWPRVQQVIAAANRDGDFCSFLGFEWQSNIFGDQCVVFPGDHQPICYAQSVPELRRFCLERDALLIPHHIAYPKGRRGINWEVFEEACTPVIEIFSMHGLAEHDRGPYAMVMGSPGGRETANTVRAALARGLRFGFTASSDNHAGFPGAYGEGLMGALVEDLTRPAILEAIRARRTYALTGDRIDLDFSVNGVCMGSTIEAGRSVEVAYQVAGRDEIEMVEIIQDGRAVHRAFAEEQASAEETFAQPFQVRLEWGWGPWASLGLQRLTDWKFDLELDRGRIRRLFPCLASGPFDEERRHRFDLQGERRLAVRSYTSRQGAYKENPNQSLVLEIEGGADTRFRLGLEEPVGMEVLSQADELFTGSHPHHVGPFPAESFLWHRILAGAASRVADKCSLDIDGKTSTIYLRAQQRNGHMAWSSPVFVNYR